jgi:hypothetical protein
MASGNSNVGKTFNFKENGHGKVIHEARVPYKTWSCVIQILEFTDPKNKSDKALRFGYCNKKGKLIARPLYLLEDELVDLGKAVAGKPEVKKMLKAFCDQIR